MRFIELTQARQSGGGEWADGERLPFNGDAIIQLEPMAAGTRVRHADGFTIVREKPDEILCACGDEAACERAREAARAAKRSGGEGGEEE